MSGHSFILCANRCSSQAVFTTTQGLRWPESLSLTYTGTAAMGREVDIRHAS
jgi:hypothetical protein